MTPKIHILAGIGLMGALAVGISVIAATDATFDPDIQPIGYVAQPAVSSSNVASGSAKMYTVDYNAREWSGNLHSYPIDASGSIGTTRSGK